MNAGPARIPQSHVTLDYCRELGVPIEVFANDNLAAFYYQENAGPLSGKAVRGRAAMTDYYGYVAELLTKATDRGSLDDVLTGADRERLVEFLRHFGDLKNGRYVGSSRRRGFGAIPGFPETRQPSARIPSLEQVLQSTMGLRFDFDANHQMGGRTATSSSRATT